MDRHEINSTLSFNITVNCNLNCDGCFIGSNFDYRGHSSWKDHEQIIKRWAEKVDVKAWEIYGGEPLLNPDWHDWFVGLSEAWPEAKGWLTSNGYAITASKNRRLYELLERSNGQYWLEVSHHNDSKLEWLYDQIRKFLVGEIRESDMTASNYWRGHGHVHAIDMLLEGYAQIKDPSWPEISDLDDWNDLPNWIREECLNEHDLAFDGEELEAYSREFDDPNSWLHVFEDGNGVRVIVRPNSTFTDGAMGILDDHSGLHFHDSDPARAHEVCNNRTCLEYHDGNIHKCSSAGHFKGWTEQLPVHPTDRQQALIDSYEPLTADESVEDIAQWFERTHMKPIPQCALCPEVRREHEIFASTKKITFHR